MSKHFTNIEADGFADRLDQTGDGFEERLALTLWAETEEGNLVQLVMTRDNWAALAKQLVKEVLT